MTNSFEKFNNYTRNCFKEDPPPCRCACPFKLNVRSFTGKMARGKIESACREYRNAVVFPEIVSRICDAPCEAVCVRKGNDGVPVSLRGIEAACLAGSRDRKPVRYDLPQQQGRIAVVGAGPSGLACALKLAARHFSVTVIFAEAETGGSLAGSPAKDVYRAEIDSEMDGLAVELRPNTVIKEIEPLLAEGFDAVYIATGCGGETFGLEEGLDPDSLGSRIPGVFIGGEAVGADKTRAIENGARVSRSIEKYLKVGAMDGMAETYEAWPINDQFYRPITPAPPADTGSEGGAIEEAGRCKDCECSLCIEACPMLEGTKRTPKKITDDVTVSVNKVEQQTRRVANRLMNACNLCGLCKEVCPVDAAMGDCMLEARKDVFEQGGQPPAFHDYYLRDMGHAQSEEAYFEYTVSNKYLFFPGCQAGASLPDYVVKPYEALREAEGDVGVLLSCCGAPAEWAGDERLADELMERLRNAWETAGRPTIICSCLNCMKRIAERLPDVPLISWFEWMDHSGMAVSGAGAGNPLYVFDPCAARYIDEARGAVRSLLDKAGIEYQSGRMSGALAECCGYGGHIYASNPDLYKRVLDLRTMESELPYLAYCSNCRDAFSASGKRCSHIFDVLFGIGDGEREAPRLAERRMNRRYLKKRISEICLGPGICGPEKKETPQVIIPLDLGRKMERGLISEEDVQNIISDAENTDMKHFDAETGHSIAHGAVGVSTCWVIYMKENDGFHLINVYSHRMKATEEA